MISAKRIELWGLALILASSFVQIFLLSPSQDLTNDVIRWKIEEKLDLIFTASRLNFKQLYPEADVARDSHGQLNDYKYVEMNKNLETTQSQTEKLQWIVGAFFLLGSSLLLVGKNMEITKSSDKANSADARNRAAD